MSSHSIGIDPGAIYAERRLGPMNGLDTWANGLLGSIRHLSPSRRAIRDPVVAETVRLEAKVARLSNGALRSELWRVAPIAIDSPERRAQSLALVREAARRSLAMTPYETQIYGASILLEGKLAEMHTGEGKTLTAGLAAAVAACGRMPVHVVTVNDYLAQRDSEKLAPLYKSLGLSVGVILTGMSPEQRRKAYLCDITYCTGKELVFDYLKDKVAVANGRNRAHLEFEQWLEDRDDEPTLLRGLHFAIVDEADSIFIDEARTPLILSVNAGASDDLAQFQAALDIARKLTRQSDFRLRASARELELTDLGRSRVAEMCCTLGPEWNGKQTREHLVSQALRALHLFHRDQQYVIKDEKVQIVDENTGRILPGRTWEHGLHQMIEVKEGAALSDRARTVARITYQRFFRRFLRLSGMTGTAREVRGELWRVYGLQTVLVGTHRPCIRKKLPMRVCPTLSDKWRIVCEHASTLSREGKPVLIGTRSVEASEQLSAAMTTLGIAHRVLNAIQDSSEAALIESAGLPGVITVATNMAGRGTDIGLGPAVAQRGGLTVILTEFHDSRRVDRQLFGRGARQGDPGSARSIVSLEDQLFVLHASWLRKAVGFAVGGWLRRAFAAAMRWKCQRQVEALHAKQRAAATRSDQNIETMLSFSGRG